MGVFDAPLRRLGQELRGLRVRFVAVTQGIDTDESNPNSRLMLNLLAAFAEFERELIVERIRAGLARVRRGLQQPLFAAF